MKHIIFKGENIAKINEAIKAAEGKARASLLDYNKIYETICRFNKRYGVSHYNATFTLKELEGTTIHIASDTGSYMGREASKYTKMVTEATLTFHNSKWYLENVRRVEASNYKMIIEFSETAKAAIIKDESHWY